MKIKTCPFCGGRGYRRTIKIPEYTGVKFPFHKTGKIFNRRMIECVNPLCKLRPSTWLYLNTTNWNTAIKSWNKRPIHLTKNGGVKMETLTQILEELYKRAIIGYPPSDKRDKEKAVDKAKSAILDYISEVVGSDLSWISATNENKDYISGYNERGKQIRTRLEELK